MTYVQRVHLSSPVFHHSTLSFLILDISFYHQLDVFSQAMCFVFVFL